MGSNVLGDRELGEVVADHLGLDLDLVEHLAGVDANNRADHLRDDNHVTEVSLDDVGLLVGLGLLFSLAELLDETHGLALQAAVDSSAGTGVDDITELVRGEVEEPAMGRVLLAIVRPPHWCSILFVIVLIDVVVEQSCVETLLRGIEVEKGNRKVVGCKATYWSRSIPR